MGLALLRFHLLEVRLHSRIHGWLEGHKALEAEPSSSLTGITSLSPGTYCAVTKCMLKE